MKILSSKSRGVTLVELSIVLAILGILIVATISGKSLIDMARATATIQTFKDRSVAMQLFDASYSATPGDAPTASIADLSAPIFGDGLYGINTYTEIGAVDYHFFLAKLYAKQIQGAGVTYTAGTAPASGTVDNGVMMGKILSPSKVSGAVVFTFSLSSTDHYHAIGALGAATTTITAVSSPMFKIIDTKTDDGVYGSGYVTCRPTITLASGAVATLGTAVDYTTATGCVFAASSAM